MDKIQVHLHGYLAAFHDGPISVAVSTAAEAIESITRQLPGFAPHPINGPHRIAVVGYSNGEDLFGPLKGNEIHIIPQFTGGKNGGFLQIAIGAALIAGSFIPGVNAVLASAILSGGIAMLLGGVSQLLFPAPEAEEEDTKKSRYLGAPKNTTEIGTRIPILYGEHQVFGHILSADIQSINKAVDS